VLIVEVVDSLSLAVIKKNVKCINVLGKNDNLNIYLVVFHTYVLRNSVSGREISGISGTLKSLM